MGNGKSVGRPRLTNSQTPGGQSGHVALNNRMQRAALLAAADASRWADMSIAFTEETLP